MANHTQTKCIVKHWWQCQKREAKCIDLAPRCLHVSPSAKRFIERWRHHTYMLPWLHNEWKKYLGLCHQCAPGSHKHAFIHRDKINFRFMSCWLCSKDVFYFWKENGILNVVSKQTQNCLQYHWQSSFTRNGNIHLRVQTLYNIHTYRKYRIVQFILKC